MKTTPRERLLLALLPAVALGGAYLGLVRPRLEARIDSASSRSDPADGSIADRAVRHSAESLAQAQRDLDAAMRHEGDVSKRAAALRERWSSAPRRADSVREVSSLLGRRGARVERSSIADDGANAPSAIPPSLRALQQAMASLGGEKPEVWRFDLRCGFGELRAALDDLARARAFALPVSLALEPATGPDDLSVSLWMWI